MAKQIKARIIIEVVGAPKDHVEATLKSVVDKIKEEKELNLLKSELVEAKEVQLENIPQKIWSAFSEVEISVNEINRLIGFCFDFMPSSIEILEPTNLDLNAGETSDMLNDLLAGLHRYDLFLKNVHAQNILFKKELDELKKVQGVEKK